MPLADITDALVKYDAPPLTSRALHAYRLPLPIAA